MTSHVISRSFTYAATVVIRKIDHFSKLLIHLADPHSHPVMIIIFVHVVRPSVRKNLGEQNNFQVVKIVIATGETVGLAKWIFDDPCLVTLQTHPSRN